MGAACLGVSVCVVGSGQPVALPPGGCASCFFVAANELHNDPLDGRPLCGGGAEEVLGALEGRSHVIPRDFVRLLVCLQGR